MILVNISNHLLPFLRFPFSHMHVKLHYKLESEKQIKVDRNDDTNYVMKRKDIWTEIFGSEDFVR